MVHLHCALEIPYPLDLDCSQELQSYGGTQEQSIIKADAAGKLLMAAREYPTFQQTVQSNSQFGHKVEIDSN